MLYLDSLSCLAVEKLTFIFGQFLIVRFIPHIMFYLITTYFFIVFVENYAFSSSNPHPKGIFVSKSINFTRIIFPAAKQYERQLLAALIFLFECKKFVKDRM